MKGKLFSRKGAKAQSFIVAILLLITSCSNSNGMLEKGAVLPDYTGITPDGDTLSLSSFTKEEKILFVNFWAAWCGDCLKHNPEIAEMHKLYEGKFFGGHALEMLSISLDKDTLLWKRRIAQQNLNHINQITDMRGWESKQLKLFSVHFIPANYLVDHTGKIIAVDVEGDELEKILKKYYAK